MRERDMAVIERQGDDGAEAMTAARLLDGRPVLVLAPHPDDESLACGNLLAAAFTGSGAHVVCLTDGAASHPGSIAIAPDRLAMIRRAELEMAIRCLGGGRDALTWLGEPDGRLAYTPALVDRLAALADDGRFGLCVAPSPLDPHCDHVAAAAIARSLVDRIPQLRLVYYPVWSRWHGRGRAPAPEGSRPLRLSGTDGSAKRAAIAAHRSQLGLVVPDAPDGFEMPPGFAAYFGGSDEIFFLADRAAEAGSR